MRETSDKLNGRKWLTALMVSPGMLFLFGYLLLQFSVHIYLNRVVKSYLSSQNFSSQAQMYQAKIGRLDVDFWLTSLTIHDLRLIITPIDLPGKKSGLSVARERYFPAVEISGNWIDRVISLSRTSLDKIVINFSSVERPQRFLEPVFTTDAVFEPEQTFASTESLPLGDMNADEVTVTQDSIFAHERLNSLFVEVLTLLSRQKL